MADEKKRPRDPDPPGAPPCKTVCKKEKKDDGKEKKDEGKDKTHDAKDKIHDGNDTSKDTNKDTNKDTSKDGNDLIVAMQAQAAKVDPCCTGYPCLLFSLSLSLSLWLSLSLSGSLSLAHARARALCNIFIHIFLTYVCLSRHMPGLTLT